MGASAGRQQALAQKSQGQASSSSTWLLSEPASNPAEPAPHTSTREHLLPGSHWHILNWAVRGPSQISTLPELPPSARSAGFSFNSRDHQEGTTSDKMATQSLSEHMCLLNREEGFGARHPSSSVSCPLKSSFLACKKRFQPEANTPDVKSTLKSIGDERHTYEHRPRLMG